MSNEVTTLIDLADSEILEVEQVIRQLNAKRKTRMSMEAFRKEAIERFGLAGFGVDVKCWTTNVEGVYLFDIEIQSRQAPPVDPDQMVHEVTNDLLGLGTKGVISTSGLHIPGRD